MSELKTRDQIDPAYKWDIEKMYPDENKWYQDLEESIKAGGEFAKYQGHVGESASALLEQLNASTAISRKFENVFVYARMRRDEDNANTKYTEMTSKAMAAGAQISAQTAFFTPELLSCDEDRIMKYVDQEPELEVYRFMLESTFKDKAHVLSGPEERIMASLGEVLGAPDEIYSMLNDADMDFGKVKAENGEEIQLTHGNFITLMESSDRNVRKSVFEQLYSHYKALNNTISTMYNYNVKENVVTTRLRKYPSALEASLSSEEIPVSVYHNLIDSVHDHLPAMYKYVGIRKRVLGVDELKMYDVYTPLVKPADISCTYDQAVEIACRALAPLGDDYVAKFRSGVTRERWVDIYENKGKTSGAYSFGTYDSYPYILMNFNGDIKDVFTLIHEGGHSMHSTLTWETQPYIYGGHSIFTAETASTVNETLLINYLIGELDAGRNPMDTDGTGAKLSEQEAKDFKSYLINFYIDEFKSTLYRQTMFAEFELKAHEYVEAGGSLTSDWLNKTYDDLNTLYFGPELSHDDYIQYEWSRIPHFYRPFYVYQYATGYSGANAIAGAILGDSEADANANGHYGSEAAADYREFLKSGDSNYPIELLKLAGIDMSTRKPVDSALDTFGTLVDELDKLL